MRMLFTLIAIVWWQSWCAPCYSEERELPNPKGEHRVASLGDVLILPVETLGKVRPFLIDTGSSFTAYDKPLSSQLNYVALGEVEGGPSFPIYETPGATIRDISLHRVPIICLNLDPVCQLVGRRLDGVVGMTDLRSRILQIDFDNGLCRFASALNDDLGRAVDLELEEEGCPYAKFRLNDTTQVSVMIDTGFSSDLALSPEVFDALVASGDITVSHKSIFVGVADGTQKSRPVGSLATVGLGNFSHSKISVARWIEGDNLVGLGYLSRYFVTFDFPHKKMYLKPGKNYSRDSWQDALGARVVLKNGEVVVDDRGEFAPAGISGMQKGDVIREIDGRKTSELSLFQVKRLFGDSGKILEIKFRRGDEIRTVNVLLRKL